MVHLLTKSHSTFLAGRRSPGAAPVDDPCGMAGGAPTPMYNGGEYTKTKYAKQGDLGSKVLKPRDTGTVWKAGGCVKYYNLSSCCCLGPECISPILTCYARSHAITRVANVSWYIAFNHGGGYKYRICPRSYELTEDCFALPEHQLEFASNEHVVLFPPPTGPKRIPNTVVKHGGGIGWMLSPIPMPNFVGSDCDDARGHPCHGCPCGSHYPGGNTENDFPNPFGKDNEGKNTAIVDLINVPNVPPGEYVVGFRWDCETSSQVCVQRYVHPIAQFAARGM